METQAEPNTTKGRQPGFEWTPKKIQNILLTFGAVLCSLAALLFVAYAWDRLGLTGRVAVLGTVTGASLAGGFIAFRRGLKATAEALTSLGLLLALIDAGAAYALGLFGADQMPLWQYSAGVAGAMSIATIGYRSVARLHATAWFAVIAAQVPVPLLLINADVAPTVVALGLGAQVLVLVAAAKKTHEAGISPVLQASAILTFAASGYAALVTTVFADPFTSVDVINGYLPLIVVAAVGIIGGLSHDEHDRQLLGKAVAVATICVTADALAAVTEFAPEEFKVLGVAFVGLAVLAAALPLRTLARNTAVGAGLAILLVPVTTIAGDVQAALLGPVANIADVWTLYSDELVAARMFDTGLLESPVSTFFILAVVAAGSIVLGSLFGNDRRGTAAALAVTGIAAAIVPPVAAFGFAASLGWYLFGGVTLAVGFRYTLRGSESRTVNTVAGVTMLAQGLVTSLASEVTTAYTLFFIGAIAAAIYVFDKSARTVLGPVVVVAGTVATAVTAHVLGVSTVAAYEVLVLLGLTASVASRYLGRLGDQSIVLVTSLLLTALGGLYTAIDPTQLSVTLLAVSAAAAITALRPNERYFGWLAAVGLLAFTWLRLIIADVHLIEAYSLPLAALVLAIGFIAGGAKAKQSSWTMYGAGLAVAFLPSTLALLSDEGITRPVLLAVAAVVAITFGAQGRLQAPVAIGVAVLLVDAAAQFGPYADQIPRWVGVGAAGVILLSLGATWERRYRDLQGLRSKYDALS